jgi:hypothetical protein
MSTILDEAAARVTDVKTNAQSTQAQQVEAMREEIGWQHLPRVDRITYDELASDLRLHYETTGTRGLKEADTRFKCSNRFSSKSGREY